MIDPSIWTDDGLGQLGLLERLMFIGLLTLADDDGVTKAESIYLKANLFPYDSFTVDEVETARNKLVDSLSNLQFFTDEDDKEYISFTKWSVYQKIIKPQPTTNPKPTFKKKAIPQAVRRELAIRYGLSGQGEKKIVACHWCKGKEGTISWITPSWVHFQDLEMDHIIPESQGGSCESKNITLSCRSCNRMRSNQVSVKSASSNPLNRIEENRKEEKGIEKKKILKEKVTQFLDTWNESYKTKYSNVEAIQANYEYWLTHYEQSQILKAVQKSRFDQYWRDKLRPDMFLRKMSPQREAVDRIADFLNIRVKQDFFVQEYSKIWSEPSDEADRQEWLTKRKDYLTYLNS